MAELKTSENDGDVDEFLQSIDHETRRRDALTTKELMTRLSGEEPRMWGSSIVGFGHRSYRTKAGGDSQWFKVGFSPRKQSLTLYIMDGFDDYEELLGELGPHSTGKSCLYIKDLEKVNRGVLEQLISNSIAHIEATAE